MTHRIGTVTAGLMIGLAVLVDGIQFLLTLTVIGSIVAMLISAFVWITFLIWFALCGVSYFDRGAAVRGGIVIVSAITELVPFINAVPAVTLGVVALIIHSRIEDRKRNNAPQNNANNQALVRKAVQDLRKSNAIEASRVAREARKQQDA